jgi:thiamine biosynthesis lipoprotein
MSIKMLAALMSCRRLRPMMGTFVAIECQAVDTQTAERAIAAAFAEVRCVEERMHPTRPGSDLAAIRSAQVGSPVSIHPWTGQVLALSQNVHMLSEGFFDPCLPDLPGHILDIDATVPDVVVCAAPVAIDLGGIAKGFAVDRAIDALRDAGCNAGLVNAGGDMRVFGPNVSVWVRTQSRTGSITLANQACAVSDTAQPNRPAEHRGYYSRVTGLLDVTVAQRAIVIASTAALADALTKCVLLLRAAQRHRALDELLTKVGATSL